MKNFRLPRKLKKKYRFAPADGCLYVRYGYLSKLKRWFKSSRHHPKIMAKGNFQNYLSKHSYQYFEYNQIAVDMLKCIRENIKPEFRRLWGQPSKDYDRLVSSIEGDGMQVVYLSSLSSRPFGYILRIDSSHNITADHFDMEILLQMIEEEYSCYDDFEEIEIDGKYKYVYREDIDDEGNFDPDEAYIKEEMPFCWDGGHWSLIKMFKTDHLKTLRRILEELQKAISKDYHWAKGLCHFINEYSPSGTAEDIYKIIELATGIDLDNTGWQWNRFNESDFENKLDYLEAHYSPRIEIIQKIIKHLQQ